MKKFFGEESGWGILKSVFGFLGAIAGTVIAAFKVVGAIKKHNEANEEVILVEDCPEEVYIDEEDIPETEVEVVDIPTEELNL